MRYNVKSNSISWSYCFRPTKLAVPRSYKNENGEYETDFIPCVLWNTIAVSTCEYCKKGDLVGVKGRIQNIADKIEIIAERVTFLSSKEAN